MCRRMAVFTLTLIRHGETGANKDHVIQGQLDVPLSEDGYKQANLIGNRLQNQHYTHIYASDLARATQTVDTIVSKNLHGKHEVIPDQRLRERKFGVVEGKSFSELKKLARLANQTVPNFTPTGAETAQQVRHRAVWFFQELCQQLLKTANATVTRDGNSNNNNGDSSSESATQPESSQFKAETPSPATSGLKRRRNSSTCVEESVKTLAANPETMPAWYGDEGPRRAESVGAIRPPRASLELCEARPHLRPLLNADAEAKSSSSPQLCVYVPSPRHRQKHRHQQPAQENGKQPAATCAARTPPPAVTPSTVATSPRLMEPGVDCPNMSLPLTLEQRLSRISSSDSDRRLSADGGAGQTQYDDDLVPCLAADVLVVSHGGWLRELLRHFVEDLGCTLPGGRGQALRLSPNTGLSKFTVSVSDDVGEPPKVVCLLIHDKDHLTENGVGTVNTYAL